MVGKRRLRLTDAAIVRLRPERREYTVWDTRTPGLGVRVRPTGGKGFILLSRTDGRSRRTALGAPGLRSVDAVRRECHALIAEGVPGATRHSEAPAFRDFVAGPWHDAHFPKYKPSSRRRVHYALASQLLPAFGATALDRITRARVLDWFDAYSATAPGGANRTLALLRQILNFACACGHLTTNPARAITPNRRSPVTRFLSREEVHRLHRTLDRHAMRSASARAQADIIRLLLLTGCRRNEILTLRWSEVHPGALALGDAKTGPRKVPLNAGAQALLAHQPRGPSPFVFPSPRDSARPRSSTIPLWNTVRREAGIEDACLHTLRHTVASHAVMRGVPVPVVSRLLGHTNAQMTLRYAHLADRDVEAAAERIGKAMTRVIDLHGNAGCRSQAAVPTQGRQPSEFARPAAAESSPRVVYGTGGPPSTISAQAAKTGSSLWISPSHPTNAPVPTSASAPAASTAPTTSAKKSSARNPGRFTASETMRTLTPAPCSADAIEAGPSPNPESPGPIQSNDDTYTTGRGGGA